MERSTGTTSITIDISQDDASGIGQLLEDCSSSETSHGPLTLETLAAMLLEDAALAHRRPGSWEGAGMIDVLQRHGYLQ